MSENKETAKVTKEQIAEWKKEFGKIYKYKTKDGKECYLKCPTRKIIAAANVYAGNDIILQRDTVSKNCFLGGDNSIVNEDKYLYDLSNHLDSMIDMVEGELKEV